MISNVLDDFRVTLACLPSKHVKTNALKQIGASLLHDQSFLLQFPTSLFQCLWNYNTPQPVRAGPGTIVSTIVNTMSLERDRIGASAPWVRSVNGKRNLGETAVISVLRNYQAPVACLSYSPCGTYLVSISIKGALFVTQTLDWSTHEVPNTGNSSPLCLQWTKFGSLILLYNNGNIVEYDLKNLAIVSQRASSVEACSAAFSNDGERLAIGTRDHRLVILDLTTTSTTRSLRRKCHERSISALSWSPTGDFLAAGSLDSKLKIWNTRTKRCIKTLSFHRMTVDALAWSPDGAMLVVAYDQCVVLYDTRTWLFLRLLTEHESSVTAIAWSSDAGRIACSSVDQSISILEPDKEHQSRRLASHVESITCVAWSPDSNTMASGSDDATMIVWNPTLDDGLCTSRTLGWPLSVAFSPDIASYSVVSRSVAGGVAAVFCSSTGHRKCVLATVVQSEFMSWSPDSSRIAVISANRLVVCCCDTGVPLVTINGGGETEVLDAKWSTDSHRILTIDKDQVTRLWDSTNGALIDSIGYGESFDTLKWSPDGTRFVNDDGRNTVLHNFEGEMIRCVGPRDEIYTANWSPSSHRLICKSWHDEWRLYSALDGVNIESYSGRIMTKFLTWSPDSDYFLFQTKDQGLVLFESATGLEVQTISRRTIVAGDIEHGDFVVDVIWSQDSARLAIRRASGAIESIELHRLGGVSWSQESEFNPDLLFPETYSATCTDGTIRITDSLGRQVAVYPSSAEKILARHDCKAWVCIVGDWCFQIELLWKHTVSE